VPPERSELVLSAHVPDGERHSAARRHRLDVEADRRYRRHRLIQFQLVQQRRLTYTGRRERVRARGTKNY